MKSLPPALDHAVRDAIARIEAADTPLAKRAAQENGRAVQRQLEAHIAAIGAKHAIKAAQRNPQRMGG